MCSDDEISRWFAKQENGKRLNETRNVDRRVEGGGRVVKARLQLLTYLESRLQAISTKRRARRKKYYWRKGGNDRPQRKYTAASRERNKGGSKGTMKLPRKRLESSRDTSSFPFSVFCLVSVIKRIIQGRSEGRSGWHVDSGIVGLIDQFVGRKVKGVAWRVSRVRAPALNVVLNRTRGNSTSAATAKWNNRSG